jgi:starch-binding outer membrane protein SusE/F
MKKIVIYSSFFAAAALFAVSCKKSHTNHTILNVGANPGITASSSNLVLKMDSSDLPVITIGAKAADWGYNATNASYDLEVIGNAATETWDNATVIHMLKNKSTQLTHFDLNDIALKHGIAANATGVLKARIKSFIPGASSVSPNLYSDVINLNVTTFAMVKSVLTLSSTTPVVVLPTDAFNDVIGMDWTEVAWGIPANTEYQLQIKSMAESWANASLINTMTSKTAKLKGKKLAQIAYDQGLAADVEDTLLVRVKAMQPGTNRMTISDEVKLVVTPYDINAVNNKLWMAGSYQNWDPANAPTIEELIKNSMKYSGIVEKTKADGTLSNGFFKFQSQPDFDGTNYGGTADDSTKTGTLSTSGGDINIPDGTYMFNVDLAALTFTYSLENWGVIGSALSNADLNNNNTADGWENDKNMRYNQETKMYEGTFVFEAGEIKFRKNDDWDTNFGDDGNNGSLEPTAANIPIPTAGTYKIAVDIQGQTYTITKLP